MIENEKDLDKKYVVFKIKDINDFLYVYERNLLWSFLTKIIKHKKRKIENKKEMDKTYLMCVQQFKHDVNNLEITSMDTPREIQGIVIELLEKYNI